MTKQTITPTFPMMLHGIEILNREEARIVIELAREDQATRDAIKLEEDIQELMNSPHHYSRAEARFIALGGVPSGSVSSFI